MVMARRCLGSEEHPSCEDPWCEDPRCEDSCREDPPHHTTYAAVGGTTGDRDVMRGVAAHNVIRGVAHGGSYGGHAVVMRCSRARWQGRARPPRVWAYLWAYVDMIADRGLCKCALWWLGAWRAGGWAWALSRALEGSWRWARSRSVGVSSVSFGGFRLA